MNDELFVGGMEAEAGREVRLLRAGRRIGRALHVCVRVRVYIYISREREREREREMDESEGEMNDEDRGKSWNSDAMALDLLARTLQRGNKNRVLFIINM